MKKINNIISIALSVLALGFSFASCTQEEDNVAKAVLGAKSVLEFAADSPQGQVITVVSDAQWHVTAPDWITVDPSTGSGTTEVTVIAANNVDSQGMLAPRKDTLIFSGNTKSSQYMVIVRQEGDSYRGAPEKSVSDIAALADGEASVVKNAQVAALTSRGYVITDGTSNAYVPVAADVKVGDNVDIKALKGTVNGMPVLSQVDGVTVLSSGQYTAPAPLDITSTIATYAPTAIEYVEASGVEASGKIEITVDEQTYAITLVDPAEGLTIDGMTAHKIVVTGFSYGLPGANTVAIIPVAIKDNGPAVVPKPESLLKAKWRFTTSKYPDYADYFGGLAGVVDLTEGFSTLYVPSNVEGSGKITYYQVDKTGYTPTTGNPKRIVGGTGHPYVTGAWPGDYWQFSATDNYEYPAGTKLHIKFPTRISATGQKYWMLEYYDGAAWQPAEEYPVSTETETGTNAQYNFIETTTNQIVECNWTLAAACREPMFRVRCVANWQSNGKGALANPNGGTSRIADNDDDGEDIGPLFEVTDSPDGGSTITHRTVYSDDFEWLSTYTEATGAGDAITNGDPSSTAPNIYSTAALEPLWNEFTAKGYDFINEKDGEDAYSHIAATNYKVVYLQKNYLKFGKTSYNAGIILPALSGMASDKADITIEFDWCWQLTGSMAPDIMTLTVESSNGTFSETGSNISANLESAQPQETPSSFSWQHVKIVLSGADASTVLTIRPTNVSTLVSNPARKQNRWYLDNIKISM